MDLLCTSKKYLSILLAIITVFSAFSIFAVNTFAYSVGDVNSDGKINAVDSNLVKSVMTGFSSARKDFLLSDLNSDGKVNAVDSNIIKNVISGIYSIDNPDYKTGEIVLGGVDICEYSIRTPSDYPVGTYKENAEYAAQILQSHIKDACGITIPVSEKPTEHDISFVYDIDSYGTEAFNITVGDGSVTIKCGSKRGPLYGAFGFLEEIVGYRFYGQHTEYLHNNKTININSGYSHTEGLNTPFKYRHTYTRLYMNNKYYGAYDGDYPDSFSAAHVTGYWDGMSSTMNTPKYGYGYGPDRNHSVFALMPDACKLDKKVIDGWYDWTIGMVCYTLDDNFNECLKNLRPYLKSLESKGFVNGDNMPMISISNNDSFDWCHCRKCNKLIDQYGSPSATLIQFIKKVSDAVSPDYPDIEFWTLAYYCTASAPVGMDIPDNLYICYCYYPGCNNHCLDGTECDINSGGAHNQWNVANVAGWLAVTDNLHVWYYTSEFSFSVNGDPIIDRIYYDIKYLQSIGCKGIFGQNSNDSLGWDDLTAYLMSEMMWNPDMTIEEYKSLAKEFCSFKYGAGGDKLYEYFMFMEEACNRSGCWCSLSDSPNYVYDYKYLSDNLDCVVDLIETALSETETDEEYENVERISLQMYFVFLSASYDKMYVNGDSASKAKYAQMYEVMYNRFVKYKDTVKFSDMPGTTDAAVPEVCDTTVSPISWYSDQDVRINGRWW